MAYQIVHVPSGASQAYWFAECLFRFLVSGKESGGSYSTMELWVPPGRGPDAHQHDSAEEQFYVVEGELTYWVGDATFAVAAGDFIHIPRGTPHSFKNGATQARLLATFSPAAAGDWFQGAGEPIDDHTAAARLREAGG